MLARRWFGVCALAILVLAGCDSESPVQFALFLGNDGSLSLFDLGCDGERTEFDSIVVKDFPVDSDGRWTGTEPLVLLQLPGGAVSTTSGVELPGLVLGPDAQVTVGTEPVEVGLLSVEVVPLGSGVYLPVELLERRNEFIAAGQSADALADLREAACG